jgi:hypothetical protein
MVYFCSWPHFLAIAQGALAAVRQWPITNRCVIQTQGIVVSFRGSFAMLIFTLFPF